MTSANEQLQVRIRGIESDAVRDRDPVEVERRLLRRVAGLCKPRGYMLVRNPFAGVDVAICRFIDISSRWCLGDIILFRFVSGEASIKVSEGDDSVILSVEGVNVDLGAVCKELTGKTEGMVSSLHLNQGNSMHGRETPAISPLLKDLESYSANLLIRRFKYYRLNGKSIAFWPSPALLTLSKLQNDYGDDKPWIAVRSNAEKYVVDLVSVADLASYLDFRRKEATVLGKDLFADEREPADLAGKLRVFRFLTLIASLTLVGVLLVYAGSIERSLPLVYLGLILAILIESSGGWGLIRAYRQCSGGCPIMDYSPWRVAPDEVVAHEKEFSQNELSYLYSKYGGAVLSKLRKELMHQRISELIQKTKRYLGRASELETEGLYSETVLSLDQATRSVLAATLLSAGVEIRGRGAAEWVEELRKTLPNVKFEDLGNLWALRDRVSSGRDATKSEARRSEVIAETIIGSALSYLRNDLREKPDALRPFDELRTSLPTGGQVEGLLQDYHSDPRDDEQD